MKSLIALLLILPTASLARDFAFDKAVDIGSLEKSLRANAFEVTSTSCFGTKCVIIMPDTELKDPTTLVALEPVSTAVTRQARVDLITTQAIALAKKLKATPGVMTAAERDGLLLRLCFLVLSQDQD